MWYTFSLRHYFTETTILSVSDFTISLNVPLYIVADLYPTFWRDVRKFCPPWQPLRWSIESIKHIYRGDSCRVVKMTLPETKLHAHSYILFIQCSSTESWMCKRVFENSTTTQDRTRENVRSLAFVSHHTFNIHVHRCQYCCNDKHYFALYLSTTKRFRVGQPHSS